jgi:polyisoprenoid-binding protein YceI
MTTAAQPETKLNSASASTWNIDPASSVARFSVRNCLLFLVRFRVAGEFRGVTGSIALDTTALELSSVTANISTATIDTGNALRDKHLRRADFFEVERFPAMTFRSTAITPLDPAAGQFQVTGQLTMKGRDKEVVLQVVVHPSQDHSSGRLHFTATTTLSRRDVGLDHSSWYSAIGDEVEVTLAIDAATQAAMQATSSGGTAPIAA